MTVSQECVGEGAFYLLSDKRILLSCKFLSRPGRRSYDDVVRGTTKGSSYVTDTDARALSNKCG